jgi:hypothetical protein
VAKGKKAPVPGDVGRLVLRRFCGDEEYLLTSARMRAFEEEGFARLWFDAETEGEWVGPEPDTGGYRPRPAVRVRVHLPSLVPGDLVGQSFAPADREPNGDGPGSVHYFDTDELEQPVVEVLSRDGPVFEVRICGSCTDVNFYDGSKPPTRVELVGRFTFADLGEWE